MIVPHWNGLTVPSGVALWLWRGAYLCSDYPNLFFLNCSNFEILNAWHEEVKAVLKCRVSRDLNYWIEKYHLRRCASLMTQIHKHDLEGCKPVTERNGKLCVYLETRAVTWLSCSLFGAKLITEYSFYSLHSDDSKSALSIQSLALLVRKLLATVSSAALMEHSPNNALLWLRWWG